MTAENAPQASIKEDEVTRDYIKTSLKYLHQVLNLRDEVSYWWRGHSGYSEFYRFKTNLKEWRDQLFAYWLDEKDQLLSGKNGPFFLMVQGDAEIWVERDLLLKETTTHPKEPAPESVAKEPVQEPDQEQSLVAKEVVPVAKESAPQSVAKEPEKKKDVDRITISKHEYDLFQGVIKENDTLKKLLKQRDNLIELYKGHVGDLKNVNQKLKAVVQAQEDEYSATQQKINEFQKAFNHIFSKQSPSKESV